MDLELENKVAFITGSSKGIGLAIAHGLQQAGCKVILNGRNAETLAQAQSSLVGAKAVVGDVSDPTEATRVVNVAAQLYGRLDIVVCNVGSGASVPPGQESFVEWQRVFANNFWSTTNTVEAAKPFLIAAKGCIVCVSSICGVEVIPGAPVTYSVAKAALNAYIKGIARTLGEFGIRINGVAPGNILFDGSVWSRKLREDASAVAAMLKANVALATLGSPQQVADLVIFLASARAGFATGAIWTLDGGQIRS